MLGFGLSRQSIIEERSRPFHDVDFYRTSLVDFVGVSCLQRVQANTWPTRYLFTS